MELAIKYIREQTKRGQLMYSDHAQHRMREREIDYHKVEEAILNGKPIEHQDFGNDRKVLFQEETDGIPQCYVIIAAAYPEVVVSVCRTWEEVWEIQNGFLKRKRGE